MFAIHRMAPALLLLCVNAPTAHALIIEGTLKGTILDSSFIGASPNFGNPAQLDPLTVTFWYDTDLLSGGPLDAPYNNVAIFAGLSTAMTFDYQIGDRHVTFNDVDPTPNYYDAITLQRSVEGDTLDLINMLMIQEAGTITKANSSDYTNKNAEIFFVGNDGTLNIAQQFSWSDPDYQPPKEDPNTPYDWPYYYVSSISLHADGILDGVRYYESIGASITEFTIGPRAVAVSEPSALGLLIGGLMFLVAGGYRRQQPNA